MHYILVPHCNDKDSINRSNPMQGESCITTGCCGCQLKQNTYIIRLLMQVCCAEKQRGTNLLYSQCLRLLSKCNYTALALYCISLATLGNGLLLLTIFQDEKNPLWLEVDMLNLLLDFTSQELIDNCQTFRRLPSSVAVQNRG